MWWIISSIVGGLIVGAIARFLMPGTDRMGCVMTILLGIAGSFVGGFVATLLWRSSQDEFRPAGFLMSVVGAFLLLLLWRMISKRS
jgi:uncharacterized membrane protein YeaQ/YmgE (transglycosylase-associated protein family)